MGFETQPVFAAFSSAPRPAADELTAHRCCECDRVRDDFARFESRDVPDDVLRYHGDSLPLLTPKAFRYFLPRYIEFTCEQPDTNATDSLLFNLAPDDAHSAFWSGRCAAFTASERAAVVRYLEHRCTWPDADLDAELIDRALAFWRDRGPG